MGIEVREFSRASKQAYETYFVLEWSIAVAEIHGSWKAVVFYGY